MNKFITAVVATLAIATITSTANAWVVNQEVNKLRGHTNSEVSLCSKHSPDCHLISIYCFDNTTGVSITSGVSSDETYSPDYSDTISYRVDGGKIITTEVGANSSSVYLKNPISFIKTVIKGNNTLLLEYQAPFHAQAVAEWDLSSRIIITKELNDDGKFVDSKPRGGSFAEAMEKIRNNCNW